MNEVILREENVIIPTYEISEYDKNPMFLEKRVYQGSSGRVYPHPVCEGVEDVKTDKEYKAIYLENDYILVMILPELGGRIQRLYDKTNGYDAVYFNEVIKPALVGLAGPWISGGIEFNWPQHHRPSTYDPVDYRIEKNDDGSVTVWVGETEKMFHTKGMAGFTVYPDKAYLEIKGQVYNPTDRPQTFLWWANPAVAVNDYTKSIFPPDVNAVMDHGKRDVSKFPIADGVYYKVDYSPGTDISMYKNIPVPTSYMAYHSDFDFIGNYDFSADAGLIHIANHHISPGKKQWTWGNGDFGRAWDRNLTDENGPYIELMTGMFTDNQPDFTFLKPYEEKRFVQYFMPYKTVGDVKNASAEIMINLDIKPECIELSAYSPCNLYGVEIVLSYDGRVISRDKTDLSPVKAYKRNIAVPDVADKSKIRMSVYKDGSEIIGYTPVEVNTDDIPSPAEALPVPQEVETNEKLFLAATHLEQYRHATYSPEDYYKEGLRRDADDIRLNNGYGKYLYNKGLFEESEQYFRRAVKSSTWKNPNPYDCEPYFNLGLSLRRQNKRQAAFDAFFKAVWDGNMQDKAYYQLACIAAGEGDFAAALEFTENSLERGTRNMQARALKSALLRKLGRTADALAFAEETRKLDPLCHAAYFERILSSEAYEDEFKAVMRGDNHNYIELALTYMNAYLYDDAQKVLNAAPNDEPMVHYYLYYITDDKNELEKAERASSLYCFPNRTDDVAVLEKAVENGGCMAAYYLGCLLYDKGVWERAERLWADNAERINIPAVYRNLSLVYFNKTKDTDAALRVMEKAFAMDKTDARIFFELDQLYKALNYSLEDRLANMNNNAELLEKRDDLYTEYITLLNMNGEYENAYNRIMSHKFHSWEGGEGKITAQYRESLINKAKHADKEDAVKMLNQALVYPHNLGEGKLIGNMDNDIYYMLAQLYDGDKKKEAYELASRGEFNLSSAMYYNDQPPQMMYYAAKALAESGMTDEAEKRFKAFIEYAKTHMNDEVRIEYFAVSLPDFLIYEGDLTKNNKVHCHLMAALGYKGLGQLEKSKEEAEKGLELCRCNAELYKLL